jgi:outer membrane lipoprotein-sorting protein
LRARKPSSYEKLHVLVNPKTGDLLKTTVFFVLGNVTEVAFSNIELNVDPAASLFRLDPPADVRVIELNEPSR